MSFINKIGKKEMGRALFFYPETCSWLGINAVISLSRACLLPLIFFQGSSSYGLFICGLREEERESEPPHLIMRLLISVNPKNADLLIAP